MLSGLARAYVTNISDVLCIGLGVGIVPMDFAHQGARVDVVEINPAVVPVGTRYFNFEPAKVRLTIDDGRHFLNNCTNQYDTVVLDAFLGDSSPSHLMTREAFESIRRVLRPGGALVINCFGDLIVLSRRSSPGCACIPAARARSSLQPQFVPTRISSTHQTSAWCTPGCGRKWNGFFRV
jgi:spermidine synthase